MTKRQALLLLIDTQGTNGVGCHEYDKH